MNKLLPQVTARLTLAAKPRGTIDTDTPIIPLIVADTVVGVWLASAEKKYPKVVKTATPAMDKIASYLESEANRLYGTNPKFKKLILAPGNKGRDMLRAFMFHWLTARMLRSFPEIKLSQLPREITGVSHNI